MKVKFFIDGKYTQPEIIICADKQTGYLTQVKKSIEGIVNVSIAGYTASGAKMITGGEIIRIYTEKDRVFVECTDGIYTLREKLYELEEKLDGEQFVRISRAEIVNICKILRLDTSITGTIKVFLQGGLVTYVSRRNVTKIKNILGI